MLLASGTSGISTVLTLVTTLLTWMLSSFTSITSWLVGNDLGGVYLGIFIIGACVAMMYRVLHSA